MENQLRNNEIDPIILLHCIREDGQRETTKLTHQSLSDAHDLAKWVLHGGNGLYREVQISSGDRIVEIVHDAETIRRVGK